jgi:hypothetical protein
MSRLQPGAGALGDWGYPADPGVLDYKPETFPDRFVNVHEHFQTAGKDVLLYFATLLHCPEAMDVTLLLGCDGPLKLWLDGRALHHEPAAVPPAVPDTIAIPVRLTAGDHEVVIAIGSNHGKTWGFFCRVERTDLHETQLGGDSEELRLPEWENARKGELA